MSDLNTSISIQRGALRFEHTRANGDFDSWSILLDVAYRSDLISGLLDGVQEDSLKRHHLDIPTAVLEAWLGADAIIGNQATDLIALLRVVEVCSACYTHVDNCCLYTLLCTSGFALLYITAHCCECTVSRSRTQTWELPGGSLVSIAQLDVLIVCCRRPPSCSMPIPGAVLPPASCLQRARALSELPQQPHWQSAGRTWWRL